MSSFRKTLTGKTFASGTWVKGIFTEGSATEFEFTASVQPLTPKELNALPEGERKLARFRLFTSYRLKTADDSDDKKSPDQVQIEGQWYTVTGIDIWQNKVIPHYKAIVSLNK